MDGQTADGRMHGQVGLTDRYIQIGTDRQNDGQTVRWMARVREMGEYVGWDRVD